MDRRDYIKLAGVASAGGIAALAGCSESGETGGSEGEVVENELEGTVNVTDMQLENTQIRGTTAVVARITVENTESEEVGLEVVTEFFDGETKIGTDERSNDSEYTKIGRENPGDAPEYRVEAGGQRQLDEAIEGRVDDVTRYEIRIDER